MLGAIWVPAGRQGISKWQQEVLKVEQNGVQEEVLGKAVKIIGIFIE